MTEQTRIPVPEGEGPRGNSIERAVEKFELGSFNPPPIPGGLEPRRPRRPVRLPAIDLMPKSAAVPAPAPVSAPAPVETPVAAAQPDPAPAPVPQAAPDPVRFTGKQHKVNRKWLREQGLIVPEGNVTALLEEFRIVKRQLLVNASDLRRQGSGAAAQRILVSSAHPGEGKSYCAVNLALSIAAEMESEVLLVDADFAKPSIPAMLGLPDGPGLIEALTDPKRDPVDFVLGTDIPGLWVLPAGASKTNADTEYLGSLRGAEVLDRLTQGAPHRIVLFDSPPALAASTAGTLAKYVGQVMLVVRADQTGQGALEDAISLLSACPNIQLLLNGANFSPSGRTFGAYHGYGGG